MSEPRIPQKFADRLNQLIGKVWMYKLKVYKVCSWVYDPDRFKITIQTASDELTIYLREFDSAIENFLPVSNESKRGPKGPRKKDKAVPMEYLDVDDAPQKRKRKPYRTKAVIAMEHAKSDPRTVIDRDGMLKDVVDYQKIVKKNIDSYRKENDMVSVKLFNDSVKTYVDLAMLQIRLREIKNIL